RGGACGRAGGRRAGGRGANRGGWGDVPAPARRRLAAKPLTGPTDIVNSVAFSRDGRELAAGGNDDKLWRWNIARPAKPARLAPLRGATNWIMAVAFSPRGPGAGRGGRDGPGRLWGPPTRAPPPVGPPPPPRRPPRPGRAGRRRRRRLRPGLAPAGTGADDRRPGLHPRVQPRWQRAGGRQHRLAAVEPGHPRPGRQRRHPAPRSRGPRERGGLLPRREPDRHPVPRPAHPVLAAPPPPPPPPPPPAPP